MSESGLSTVDRLNIASGAAPILRRRSRAVRKLRVVDANGKTLRVVDDVEIAKAVLARADIEFSMFGQSALARCKRCGMPFERPKRNGRQDHHCERCRVLLLAAPIVCHVRFTTTEAQEKALREIAASAWVHWRQPELVTPLTWDAVLIWIVRAAVLNEQYHKITVSLSADELRALDALIAATSAMYLSSGLHACDILPHRSKWLAATLQKEVQARTILGNRQ